MTAQPEVVWVTWFGDYWHASLDTVGDDYVRSSIPYVSQPSLTAALAERDAFEVSRDFWKRGWAEIDQQHATVSAERDKLAKELGEVRMELNRLSAKSNHD